MFWRVELIKSQPWLRKWLGTKQAISHYLNKWWPTYQCLYVCVTRVQCIDDWLWKTTLLSFKSTCPLYKYCLISRQNFTEHHLTKSDSKYFYRRITIFQIILVFDILNDLQVVWLMSWGWMAINSLRLSDTYMHHQNTTVFSQENAFDNAICKMMSWLSLPQCVNSLSGELKYLCTGYHLFIYQHWEISLNPSW